MWQNNKFSIPKPFMGVGARINVERDQDFVWIRKAEFIAGYQGNLFFRRIELKNSRSDDVIEFLNSCEPYGKTLEAFSANHTIMYNPVVFIHVYIDDNDLITIEMNGSKEIIEHIVKKLDQGGMVRDALITWVYNTNSYGGSEYPMELNSVKKVYDSHHPYIKGGIENFIDRYLASESNVLILMGPPGGGKTSFIKHLIYTRRLKTTITFDESMILKDSFFINWMFSNNSSLLVIEDADDFLKSRENDSNRVMSKLLNASDGLIKAPNKKIIFTTNITQLSKFDDAIIRPGRCFDVVDFRNLTFDEANKVVEDNNLPPLDKKTNYSLGKIFNRDDISATKNKLGVF